MAKIVLVVEYDGTRFHGFQYQENAITVQAELERAINKLTQESIRIIAASRTDAGVHARGQVVSFRTNVQLSSETWIGALNYYLPPDVAVKKTIPVDDKFDVRRDAVRREYQYSILNNKVRSPLKLRFAYFYPQPLDVGAMQEASRTLEGQHDFASFTPAVIEKAGKSIRTVYQSRIEKLADTIYFSMVANSFLPHQIRHTVGALLQVGRGKIGITEFKKIREARRPGLAGPAVPPHGLCLMSVQYLKSLGNE